MNKFFTATLKGKDGNGETENIKEDHDDETLGKYDKEAWSALEVVLNIKKRKCRMLNSQKYPTMKWAALWVTPLACAEEAAQPPPGLLQPGFTHPKGDYAGCLNDELLAGAAPGQRAWEH